jgi:hypothetical protein
MTRTSRGIGRFLKRMFRRGEKTLEAPSGEDRTLKARTSTPPATPPVHRQSDIPFDLIDRVYTPLATSSKASFRSDGADHERDQDLTLGVVDERWNEEDRFTNKSGDPRIGTHGRNHESAEARTESR